MSTKILNYLSWDDSDGGRGDCALFPKKVRCLICGASGSGKTQLVLNMILQKWITMKNLIIVTPSLFQPMYQVLIHGLQHNLPFPLIINIFREKESIKNSGLDVKFVIEKLGDEIGKGENSITIDAFDDVSKVSDIAELSPNTLIIFDDLMLDKAALKRAEEFFTRGRPRGINIVFISQSYYEVPRRTIRENCNFLILFKQNKKSLDSLYRDEGSDIDRKEFEGLCKEAWRDRHSFLVVDKTSSADEGKYRIGFDTFYIPRSYV